METAKIGGKCRNVAEIVGKFKNLWSMTEKGQQNFLLTFGGKWMVSGNIETFVLNMI